ncbi:hypothetical protein LTR85_009109 [Meristemomyces frigidus]|nr:hypothetical protein LTR85_009109 [Meristemomyces frigidus]
MDARRLALDPSHDEPLATRHGLETFGDLYSDYTITCNGYTAKVHRVVLHIQSKFFATAFRSGFREGQPSSAAMELPEDDPVAVEAMIQFFYNGRYTVPSPTSRPAFDIKIFVMADKYEAGGLEAAAWKNFQGLCDPTWRRFSNEDLVAVVHAIAESDGVRRSSEMKEIALRAMEERLPGLLQAPAFKWLLQELPEWYLALLKKLSDTAAGFEPARGLAPIHPLALAANIGAARGMMARDNGGRAHERGR